MPSDSVTFDRAADYYDETRGFPPGVEREIAALICRAGNLSRSSRVLEVGAGTGRIALPLAALARAVVGLDLSYPMLQRLRAKQRGEPVGAVVGDATCLPFPPGAFDAAVAVHVFHLIARWQDALREVARVLRPGGILLSGHADQSLAVQDENILSRVWESVMPAERTPNIGVPRDQYATFLESEGWRPVGEHQVHLYEAVETPRTFLDRVERRVWSSMWRLPDEDHAKLVAAIRETIAQHYSDPDQPITRQLNFAVRAFLPPAV
jgi:ubiquinone/menaquinone biosynthesis C-methylase UbiE